MREIFLCLCFGLCLASPVLLGAAPAEVKEVVLEGRVVCLDEDGQPAAEDDACQEQFPPRFGFKAQDGNFYLFKIDDARTVMFTDLRVRSRTLRLTAWLTGQELEIIKVHAPREGRLYDLYYYCAVCHIVAYTPGPCWCCQDDFSFVEELLSEEKISP